jgi:sulfur carrier protein ThiS
LENGPNVLVNALDELKTKLSKAPILRGPDWSLPFHISTDASNTSIEDILGKLKGNDPYVIYYINKNFSPSELNYTVIEKYFLEVIHAINKVRHYITGYPVILHTEHAAIKYLMNKPITNGMVTRWLFLL